MLRFAILLLSFATLAAAEVRDVVWGFNGTVVPGTFAPCELLLANPADKPVSGQVRLRDAGALGGVPWVAEIWLPPGGEQRLRLMPFIRADDNERRFTLSWANGRSIADLPVPALAAPGAVLLVDDGGVPRRARLPQLPAGRFPGNAALLDGLDCVVSDGPPRSWEPVQADALAAWVQGGGTLALLPGARLADLAPGLQPGGNGNGNGRGRVLVLPLVREACGLEQLAAAGWKAPQLTEEGRSDDLDAAVAQRLAELVRPDHPWGLIRTVLIVFALLIGVFWWLGRRGFDWRWLHLGLIALITVTSVALALLGRRGYGESAVWTSIAVLRPCGTQVAAEVRSSVFVTSGGQRAIRHGGGMNLYACPGEESSINGVVGGGALITEIPLYSSRHLLWRGTVALAQPSVEVVERDHGGRPSRLRIAGANGALVAAVWHGGVLRRLASQADGWHENGGTETPQQLRDSPRRSQVADLGEAGGTETQQLRDSPRRSQVADLGEAGHALFPQLALRALDLRVQRPERPCLLLLAPIPAGLAPVEGLSEPHRGLALWRIDLPEQP